MPSYYPSVTPSAGDITSAIATAEAYSDPFLSPNFYLDPSAGSDANPGTSGAPWQTIPYALKVLKKAYTGQANLHLAAGTYNLGANPELYFPSGAGAFEPLLISGAMVDSGLAARTVSASTAGSGSTYATVTDTGGGLTVNAWQGWTLRYTSGTQNGKQYLIKSNTASIFTLNGTQSVPTNGDTYVIEQGGAIISWTGQLALYNGPLVGMSGVRFTAGSGSSFLRFHSVNLFQHACQFTGLGTSGIQLVQGSKVENLGTATTIFTSNAILRAVGPHVTAATTGSITLTDGCAFNVSQANLINMALDSQQGGAFIQVQSSYLNGASFVRLQGGGTLVLVSTLHDTIIPATALTGGVQGGAVTVGNNSYALLSGCSISNTTAGTSPGDAVSVMDGAVVDMSGVTGTGNAGAGLRLGPGPREGRVHNLGSNTVTGTAGDTIIGSSAAIAWSSADLGLTVDASTTVSGIVNIAAQSFAGAKTFSGNLIASGGWRRTRTTVADAAYVVVVTDSVVSFTSLSVTRNVTLPAAATFGAGQRLLVVDESLSCSATIQITLTPNGSETINGAPTWALVQSGQAVELECTGTGWNVVEEERPAGEPGQYGDGLSGAVVYSVNTTLTADVRATTIVVNAGVSVDCAGFEINATKSITIAATGTIHQNGKAASGAAWGVVSADSLNNTAQVAGGVGGNSAAAGNPTDRPNNTSSGFDLLGGSGGAGGGPAAGAGGTNSPSFVAVTSARHPFMGPIPTALGVVFDGTSINVVLPCGCGGGGGGSNVGSGAGGGGAGVVRLRAPIIINNGTIAAKGGVGGNAVSGNGSGGGGGGGGRIILVGRVVGSGTTDVSGGAGGTKLGSGNPGNAGSAGNVHIFR